jgi:uncharacterized lipoprotein YbaY
MTPLRVKIRHEGDVRCKTALPPKAEVHRRIAKVPIASAPDAMKAARRRGLSAAMQKGSAA